MATPPGQPAPQPTRLVRAGELAARAGSLRPTDPRVRRGLHIGIGLLVGLSVGLTAVAAAGDLPDVDWRFRPLAVGAAICGLIGFVLLNAHLWRRVLESLGGTLEPSRARAIWFTSSLGRYVPTSLLMPVLRMAMTESEGIPKRVTLASVVYEGALFLTASLILSVYFVIDLPELSDEPARFGVVALPVLALAALHPRVFHRLADRVLVRFGRDSLPRSLPAAKVLEFTAAYVLGFIVAGVSVWALAHSVYPVGSDDIVRVAGAFAVGTAISVLAFVLPSGLVAREAGIVLALSPVMPAAPALALAVLIRIVQLALEVGGALLTPLLARRSR